MWLICFSVLPVHKYYVSCLYMLVFHSMSSEKFIILFDRINFMFQINITIFREIKMKRFCFCCFHKLVVPHRFNDLIKLLWSILVIFLCWYKRCSCCLIYFFSFSQIFSVFICANFQFPFCSFASSPSSSSSRLMVYQQILLYHVVLIFDDLFVPFLHLIHLFNCLVLHTIYYNLQIYDQFVDLSFLFQYL